MMTSAFAYAGVWKSPRQREWESARAWVNGEPVAISPRGTIDIPKGMAMAGDVVRVEYRKG